MNTKPVYALRLEVTLSDSREYLTFNARTVEKVERSDGTFDPRGLDAWSRDTGYTGIALGGQRDRDRERRDEDAYALRIGLHTGFSDILPVDTIGRSITTLRRAEKRLNEVYAIEGSATSFAQFFGRCAQALGIKEVWYFRYGRGEWATVAEAVAYLREKEAEFHQMSQPKEEVA